METVDIIVIAPPWVRLATPAEARRFPTLSDFDKWRAGGLPPQTIAEPLWRALAEVGVTSIPEHLLALFNWLATLPSTPHTKQVLGQWSSRTSFFRAWSRAVPESPARFLARVRALHADRLVASGETPATAARLAGYTSPRLLRNAFARLRWQG